MTAHQRSRRYILLFVMMTKFSVLIYVLSPFSVATALKRKQRLRVQHEIAIELRTIFTTPCTLDDEEQKIVVKVLYICR